MNRNLIVMVVMAFGAVLAVAIWTWLSRRWLDQHRPTCPSCGHPMIWGAGSKGATTWFCDTGHPLKTTHVVRG